MDTNPSSQLGLMFTSLGYCITHISNLGFIIFNMAASCLQWGYMLLPNLKEIHLVKKIRKIVYKNYILKNSFIKLIKMLKGIKYEQCRLDMRKHLFSQGAINKWNKLSNDYANTSSKNMFTNNICKQGSH